MRSRCSWSAPEQPGPRSRAGRNGGGDLYEARQPAAGDRACGGPHTAPLSWSAARAARKGVTAAHRRLPRRPRASAHPPRDDRMESRPAGRREPATIRAARGVRGKLPNRGGRVGLRGDVERALGARRARSPQAGRRRASARAGDGARVRARATGLLRRGGTGAHAARGRVRATRRVRLRPLGTRTRRNGRLDSTAITTTYVRHSPGSPRPTPIERSGSPARSAGFGLRTAISQRATHG